MTWRCTLIGVPQAITQSASAGSATARRGKRVIIASAGKPSRAACSRTPSPVTTAYVAPGGMIGPGRGDRAAGRPPPDRPRCGLAAHCRRGTQVFDDAPDEVGSAAAVRASEIAAAFPSASVGKWSRRLQQNNVTAEADREAKRLRRPPDRMGRLAPRDPSGNFDGPTNRRKLPCTFRQRARAVCDKDQHRSSNHDGARTRGRARCARPRAGMRDDG